MPTVLLVRHGRTAANASGVLAGWTPGVGLDETGQSQAKTLAARLEKVPVRFAVASPLQRCQETATALLAGRDEQLTTDDRLGECHYGDWTGRPLKELAKEKLWPVVQAHPSAVTFPGGESMPDMQHRAVAAVREYDARVAAEFGDHAVWMAVSHGDVIKAILADALGMHLDQFQRLVVDPCSVSVVRFTTLRPFAVRVNDSGTDLSALVPVPPAKGDEPVNSSDAVVGGSTGGAAATSGTS
ncbi:histidine phosphatase family protein [Kineosporia succinea]|uniref:Phosphomutase (TIGR03848 family) n=1 Tax=Kineosporia succinea TaxID=84632 RepID=A0ABT9P7N4_9ACTN|nr:histidine phosphatase family protein [Kineosporia succinea]MDP9828716.1 putative phosphomutase (TIGR03848 family) [Kineosporia succinea]